MLDELRSAGADIERLREWALYSFHSLGTDEPEEKRKRRLMMQAQLKKTLVGYENAIAFYSVYASAPHFNWPEHSPSTLLSALSTIESCLCVHRSPRP